jgi:hypothetical protein
VLACRTRIAQAPFGSKGHNPGRGTLRSERGQRGVQLIAIALAIEWENKCGSARAREADVDRWCLVTANTSLALDTSLGHATGQSNDTGRQKRSRVGKVTNSTATRRYVRTPVQLYAKNESRSTSKSYVRSRWRHHFARRSKLPDGGAKQDVGSRRKSETACQGASGWEIRVSILSSYG